jgi:hypothetical protein
MWRDKCDTPQRAHIHHPCQGGPAHWVTLGLLRKLSGPLENKHQQNPKQRPLSLGLGPISSSLRAGLSHMLLDYALAGPEPPTSHWVSPDFALEHCKNNPMRTGGLHRQWVGIHTKGPLRVVQSWAYCEWNQGRFRDGSDLAGATQSVGQLPPCPKYSAFNQNSASPPACETFCDVTSAGHHVLTSASIQGDPDSGPWVASPVFPLPLE